jgi:thiamine biosynthesis lipoprotein
LERRRRSINRHHRPDRRSRAHRHFGQVDHDAGNDYAGNEHEHRHRHVDLQNRNDDEVELRQRQHARPGQPAACREQRLVTATHVGRAWSCTVRLVVDDDRALRPAAADLQALLSNVDAAASRFRADSALSYANARAGRPVPVPRLLADLVEAAQRMAAHTDGAVDPTIGRALGVLGYDRDISAVAEDGPAVLPIPAARTWRDVRLVPAAGLLTVPLGSELDLGATAKAYTADLAAQTLARRYDTAVLVELGGDVAVAGQRPDGWCLRVAEHEGGDGELVLLRSGGLTTSTTTVRRWRRGGRAVHHIVDPRSGAPADGPWRTATVAADDALHANAASTAAIVLGPDALDWLDAAGYAARLVARDGSVHTTAGWPDTVAVAA